MQSFRRTKARQIIYVVIHIQTLYSLNKYIKKYLRPLDFFVIQEINIFVLGQNT